MEWTLRNFELTEFVIGFRISVSAVSFSLVSLVIHEPLYFVFRTWLLHSLVYFSKPLSPRFLTYTCLEMRISKWYWWKWWVGQGSNLTRSSVLHDTYPDATLYPTEPRPADRISHKLISSRNIIASLFAQQLILLKFNVSVVGTSLKMIVLTSVSGSWTS